MMTGRELQRSLAGIREVDVVAAGAQVDAERGGSAARRPPPGRGSRQHSIVSVTPRG
jgi:hypothetical protein